VIIDSQGFDQFLGGFILILKALFRPLEFTGVSVPPSVDLFECPGAGAASRG
jgi:hypothetical protein